MLVVVKIFGTGNEVMKGVQIAAHSSSTTGAWEVLYGEFIQYPDTIIPYQYYGAANVSYLPLHPPWVFQNEERVTGGRYVILHSVTSKTTIMLFCREPAVEVKYYVIM